MTAIHLQPCRHAGAGGVSDLLERWRPPHRPYAARLARARPRPQQLSRLDDARSRDIGLTAADREFLVNKPFWSE